MILNIIIIAIFMAVAIFLFLLEILLLPGITIAGIGGALFAIGGIVYAYSIGSVTGHITLVCSFVLFIGFFAWLFRAKSFQRVALKANVDSTLTSTRDLGLQTGDEGITLSRLAPIGKARFGNQTVEAKTQGDFIDEQTQVVIVRIDGYNVVVEKIIN
ncbi:MAG: NfeD family protein [Tannerella sp.]|jgi:membrane-bound ClpP family serine protease|nr:NfeD family protein [Tannerella sp.]